MLGVYVRCVCMPGVCVFQVRVITGNSGLYRCVCMMSLEGEGAKARARVAGWLTVEWGGGGWEGVGGGKDVHEDQSEKQ